MDTEIRQTPIRRSASSSTEGFPPSSSLSSSLATKPPILSSPRRSSSSDDDGDDESIVIVPVQARRGFKRAGMLTVALGAVVALGCAFLAASGGGRGDPGSSAAVVSDVRQVLSLRGRNCSSGGGDDSSTTKRPRPIVIAGPSGVGKGTLIGMLLERYNQSDDGSPKVPSSSSAKSEAKAKEYFGLSVSHTTRSPRPGEIEGVHYHFTTREKLEEGIEEGKFIEHNEVHGNLYGTSYEAVQSVKNSGRICILELDVQGVRRIKSSSLDPHYIFISPPSMELLEARLRGRGTESEADVKIRLGNAAREVEYGTAEGNFDAVLVHQDKGTAFPKLVEILQGWYPHLKEADAAFLTIAGN